MLFLVISCSGLYAQNDSNQTKEKNLLSSENVIDSVKTQFAEIPVENKIADYESLIPAQTIFADSTEQVLRDFKIAVRIDSLWQAELTNSDLYPKMQKSILESPYDDKDISPMDYEDLPTDTLKKRLAALNAKTPFEITYNPELEKMIHFYLHRNKGVMERLMSLSLYYFPLFEKVLDKYDLPLELKYLPIIESALNPKAKSRMGATGLWQFMFSTGKLQGLTVSSYVDERMDPVKATEAAGQYLTKLHKMFDDWNLVLASYNAGPGNVSRAIRRSGGETDYWKLKRYLPRETANYVPAFMAALYVFNYAKEYGFEPYKPKEIFYATDTIRIKHTIKFKQISEVTGIDKDLLIFLNPSYKLDIIPYIKGKDYAVRLPVREAGLFAANESTIYKYNEEKIANKKLPAYHKTSDRIRYRVRSGDYLGKIAQRYGVSISRIKHWNKLRSNNLRIGQHLIIYPKHPVVVGNSPSKKTTDAGSKKVYVVQKGDSLWSISKKFSDISVSQIKKWNDISGNHLKPGMTLKISNS